MINILLSIRSFQFRASPYWRRAIVIAIVWLCLDAGAAYAQCAGPIAEDPVSGATVCWDPPDDSGPGGDAPTDPEFPPGETVPTNSGDDSGAKIGNDLAKSVKVVTTGVNVTMPELAKYAVNAVSGSIAQSVQQSYAKPEFVLTGDIGRIIGEVFAGSCAFNGGCNTPASQGEPRHAQALDGENPVNDSDPVNPANGELFIEETDLSLPGKGISFNHTRVYRSRTSFDGPMGHGGDHSLNQRLEFYRHNNCEQDILHGTGRATTVRYRFAGETATEVTYKSPDGVRASLRMAKLTAEALPFWTLTYDSGTIATFDRYGLLTRLEDATGHGLTLNWELSGKYAWRLRQVTDAVGRVVRYTYDTAERLIQVAEPLSELTVNYEYDANGDLTSVRDAWGGISRFDYAGGWVDDETDVIPEGYLDSACSLACSAKSSSCDAGGICDDAGVRHSAICKQGCNRCPLDCTTECIGVCKGTRDLLDVIVGSGSIDPVGDICYEGTTGFAGCASGCETTCTESAPGICDETFGQPIARWPDDSAPDGFRNVSPQAMCNLRCPRDCATNCGYYAPGPFDPPPYPGAQQCTSCCLTGGLTCAFNPSGPLSCQFGRSCVSDCEAAFFGTDTAAATACGRDPSPGCAPDVANQCGQQCAKGCVKECRQDCSDGCFQSCSASCDPVACETECDAQDFQAMCDNSCQDTCVTATRPADGPRYGRLGDLNHNLIRAWDGADRVYLENEYGTDPKSPNFNRIVSQQFGEGHLNYYYRDLVSESAGLIPIPTASPAADHVHTLAEYEAVTICPVACPPAGPVAPNPGPIDGQIVKKTAIQLFGGITVNPVNHNRLPSVSAAPPIDHAGNDLETDGASCSTTPAQPNWGIGAKPASATVVRDPHGVLHTHYFNERGRRLRSVNHATGSEHSLEYDARGNLVGLLAPLGDHRCMLHDAQDNVIRLTRYPAADGVGDLEPISVHYDYRDWPRRLTSVSDPRNSAVALTTYDWDAKGNLISITTADGQEEQFENNAWGAPRRIVEPGGSVILFDYDEDSGAVTQQTLDAEGPQPMITHFERDSAGRLTQKIDAGGGISSWEWSGNFLSSHAYTAGTLATNSSLTYDVNAKVVVVDDGWTRTEMDYDQSGMSRRITAKALDGSAPARVNCQRVAPGERLLEEITANGSRVRYVYNGAGQITSVVAGALAPSDLTWDDDCPIVAVDAVPASGLLGTWEYDLNGQPIVSKDARGYATRVDYDGFGRPAIITYPNGSSSRMGYDNAGAVVWQSIYDASGAATPYRPPLLGDIGLLAATEMAYDAVSRLVRRDDWHFDATGALVGDGRARTEFNYNTAARKMTTTADNGATTVIESDGLGRPVKTTLPNGEHVRTTYDLANASVKQQWISPGGPQSVTTKLTPWGATKQVLVNDVATPVTNIVYDSRGLQTTVTNASGENRTFDYDAFGQVLSATTNFGESSETLSYAWSIDGQLKQRSSASGGEIATTRYSYDVLGRPVARLRPAGLVDTWSYIGASSLINQHSDPASTVFHHSYSANGMLKRVRAVRDDRLQWRDFNYDGLNRMTRASAGVAGAVVNLAWDSLGNPIDESEGALGVALSTQHIFDGQGQPTHSTHGGTVVKRNYDLLGRLVDVKLNSETSSLARFTFSGLGGPSFRAYGSGAMTQFSYDSLGRLAGIVDRGPHGNLASQRWESGLDGVPRLAGMRQGNGPERASIFQVDAGERVIYEEHGALNLHTKTLPPTAGSKQARNFAKSISGTGQSWRRYTLDGRANWKQRKSSDPNLIVSPELNPLDAYTAFGGKLPSYDNRGALLKFDDESYYYDLFGQLIEAERNGKRLRFEYDALGRMVRETGADGTTTRYGYDGHKRVLRERGGQIDVTVHGAGLDDYLARIDPDGARWFYHQDRQHSVSMISNASGRAVEWYRYSAFGEPTISSPDGPLTQSRIDNRFGYQGQPFYGSLGLNEMRARFYRPAWGRFVSPDPIGFAGGSNLYGFVGGASLSFWDPMGLAPNATGSNKGLSLHNQQKAAAQRAHLKTQGLIQKHTNWTNDETYHFPSGGPLFGKTRRQIQIDRDRSLREMGRVFEEDGEVGLFNLLFNPMDDALIDAYEAKQSWDRGDHWDAVKHAGGAILSTAEAAAIGYAPVRAARVPRGGGLLRRGRGPNYLKDPPSGKGGGGGGGGGPRGTARVYGIVEPDGGIQHMAVETVIDGLEDYATHATIGEKYRVHVGRLPSSAPGGHHPLGPLLLEARLKNPYLGRLAQIDHEIIRSRLNPPMFGDFQNSYTHVRDVLLAGGASDTMMKHFSKRLLVGRWGRLQAPSFDIFRGHRKK